MAVSGNVQIAAEFRKRSDRGVRGVRRECFSDLNATERGRGL